MKRKFLTVLSIFSILMLILLTGCVSSDEALGSETPTVDTTEPPEVEKVVQTYGEKYITPDDEVSSWSNISVPTEYEIFQDEFGKYYIRFAEGSETTTITWTGSSDLYFDNVYEMLECYEKKTLSDRNIGILIAKNSSVPCDEPIELFDYRNNVSAPEGLGSLNDTEFIVEANGNVKYKVSREGILYNFICMDGRSYFPISYSWLEYEHSVEVDAETGGYIYSFTDDDYHYSKIITYTLSMPNKDIDVVEYYSHDENKLEYIQLFGRDITAYFHLDISIADYAKEYFILSLERPSEEWILGLGVTSQIPEYEEYPENTVEKIYPGATYADLRSLFGKDGTQFDKNPFMYEWDIGNGKIMQVWFDLLYVDDDFNFPDDLVVVNSRVVDDLESIAEQITVGTTYAEVCSLLGDEGVDVGYGVILYEWNLKNGKKLKIWFNKPNETEAILPDELVVSKTRIDLVG